MLLAGNSEGSGADARSRMGVNPLLLSGVAALSFRRQWHNWLSDTSASLQKSDKGKEDILDFSTSSAHSDALRRGRRGCGVFMHGRLHQPSLAN